MGLKGYTFNELENLESWKLEIAFVVYIIC